MRARGWSFSIARAAVILLIVMLVASASGCFGGEKPTLKEEVAKLDAALVKYNDAKKLYNQGQYQNAKDEFIDCVNQFKACESTFGEISKGDVTALEKRDAGNLASSSLQYAYAAAYMRDSCTEALKKTDKVYLMKVSAEECEQSAKMNYASSMEELQRFWNSQK
jgi:hypothetical protein